MIALLRRYHARWRRVRIVVLMTPAQRDADRMVRLGRWSIARGLISGAEVRAWLAADAGAHGRPGEDPAVALRRHRDPVGYALERQCEAAVEAARGMGRAIAGFGHAAARIAPVLRAGLPLTALRGATLRLRWPAVCNPDGTRRRSP